AEQETAQAENITRDVVIGDDRDHGVGARCTAENADAFRGYGSIRRHIDDVVLTIREADHTGQAAVNDAFRENIDLVAVAYSHARNADTLSFDPRIVVDIHQVFIT